MVFPQIFILGVLAIVLTMAGGIVPLLSRWEQGHLHRFVSFSAGVLIATAFLHLLPDALERAEPRSVGLYILLSFVGLFVLEKFVMVHPCEESHCNYHHMGVTAFAGMMVHTLFDGFALGAALVVSNHLAWLVFLAIMAHKVASSFSLASILRRAGWRRRKIVLFLFLFGSVIPFGAIISMALLQGHSQTGSGLALSLSLGTFLYIATSDFLPEVHRVGEHRIQNLFAFLLGVVLMSLVTFFLPHY